MLKSLCHSDSSSCFHWRIYLTLHTTISVAEGEFLAVEHLFPDETVLEVPAYRYLVQSHERGLLAASGTDAFRILFSGYCRPVLTWIHDDSNADEFYRRFDSSGVSAEKCCRKTQWNTS